MVQKVRGKRRAKTGVSLSVGVNKRSDFFRRSGRGRIKRRGGGRR